MQDFTPPTPEMLAEVGYSPDQVQAETPEPKQEFKFTPATPEQLREIGYVSKDEKKASWFDKAVSFAAGLSIPFERLTGNIISGIAQSPTVDKALGRMEADNQAAANASPGYGTAGRVVGSILATAPTMAIPGAGSANLLKSIGSVAAGGAASGYLGSAVNDTGANKVVNAAIGGAVGAAAQGLVKGAGAIKDVFKGWQYTRKGAQQIADDATEAFFTKMGTKASDASPDEFAKYLKGLTETAKSKKDELYLLRDAIGAEEGLQINRSNLAEVVTTLKADQALGASPTIKKALNYANGWLGNNQAIDFKKASQISDEIGSALKEASRKGNYQLSNYLKGIQDAFRKDLNSVTGSTALQNASKEADEFYQSVYKPLRDTKVFQQSMADFTDYQKMAQFTKTILKNPNMRNSFSEEAKQRLIAADIAAMKQASTRVGPEGNDMVNVQTYLSNLHKEVAAHPEMFKPFADQINALNTALSIAKAASTKESSIVGATLKTALGGAAGGLIGGAPGSFIGAAAPFVMPKAIASYRVAQLLKNSPHLINTVSKAAEAGNVQLATVAAKNLGKQWDKTGNLALMPRSLAQLSVYAFGSNPTPEEE